MSGKPTYEQLEQRVKDLEQKEIKHQAIEKELKISKKLLRDVMDIAPVFICAKNLNGEFILANKRLADFYQTTVDEMMNASHADLCKDEAELKAMLADDLEVINSGRPKHIPEETMENPDGSITVLETYKIPFTAYDDPAVLMVASDITSRKRDEEERKKLEAQFQQGQKLESIGRLAGGVAHDLNNLLSPVLGYSEMLLQDFKGNDTHKESVEQIIEAAKRARDIVRRLLAFSRKQPLEFKPFDLNQVVSKFEKLLKRTIREDICIINKQGMQLPPVCGDVGQLEQVILNLAINAQDAMDNTGTLTIETALTELDHNTTSCQEKVIPGKYVMLSITDTGSGMDAETGKHLFEPFFSTKGEYGTGLGLATVYGIIKQHGGNISVHSTPGRGTTFTVYLPASRTTDLPIETDTAMPSDLHGTETILIVEDNPQVRAIAHEMLKHQGYTILLAENGKQALDMLQNHKGRVHLLLTDVIMPMMDGRALAKKATTYHPKIKVLYMSGYTDDVITPRGVLDEDVNFIPKPFTFKALSLKVRRLLDS